MKPLLTIVSVLLLAGPATVYGVEPTSKPNILIILADDMGYSDAGCYGGEIATPNLDGLAKNGLRFTQFYNTARCWPSRAAILTGYYAQQVRRDTVPGVKSGAQGTRPPWARLLPEMLKPLGYHSYHSGKWHVDGKPLQNGFDHSYSLNDHDRYFTPHQHTEDDKPLPAVDAKSGYYSTTAIADHAIKCLKEHAEKYPAKPFLEYLAFTAPHFPLQASAEDIAPYREKYLAGWDALREERWRRMKDMRIGGTLLSPIERDLGPPYPFPEAIKKLGPNELNRPLAWNDLTEEQRGFQASKMAIHAAMVDRMDREIGRVLAQLRGMMVLENTLIFFLSDNGASAEIMVRGDGHDPHAECGTGATFLSIGPGWSSMANTPFRRHKTWVHEGGISTPLIVHWPKGIPARGELRHSPGHIVDLVPTILEAAGGKPIEKWDDQPIPPSPGKSLIPLFAKDGTVTHDPIWWLHEGNRALRVGDWKIVAAGKDSPWELYDFSSDRSETKDLAKDKPEKVRELAALWSKRFDEYTAQAKKDLPPDRSVAPKGDSTIRAKAGSSDIIITTTSRVSGAIHSLTWGGKEFIDSHDHGRQLQSALNLDSGKKFIPELFNPTEAGSLADGTGNQSSSKLLNLQAKGNELRTMTQMAFWLKPGEKSLGNTAYNDAILSNHLVSKKVQIGYKSMPHAIEYEVTFTIPKGEHHTFAQFEAVTGYMPAEFRKFWSFDPKKGTVAPLDDGPGEQAFPVVFSTEDEKFAMGVYSPDQPSKGIEKAGYGRLYFKNENVVKWNCVFRVRNEKGIAPGEYRFRNFVVVGTLKDVRTTMADLAHEFGNSR